MIYPSWRQMLARSLHVQRSKVESKFFQVASTGTNGDIQNRTMVFRGYANDTNSLLAISDIRSEKYKEWMKAPKAQICWYFTKTREQYRITANVELLSSVGIDKRSKDDDSKRHDSLRKEVWSTLSDKAKEQFYWPHPKTPRQDGQEPPQIKELSECHKNFVVIVFEPNEVDYLNLKTIPQTREIHLLSNANTWTYQTVNP